MIRWLRIAGLVILFLTVAPIHILSKWVVGHSAWPSRFLAAAARIIGVKVRIEGGPLEPHTFVVANHTSWLDILILGGFAGAAFVSKAEVQRTPLVGWLADQNRTLYIDRAQRGDAHTQVRRIAEALNQPQPLAVFPEGTTSDGRHLLPFRSALLEAVAPPPAGASVRPVAIDYGDHADIVGWHSGEPGIDNVKRILGHRGTMHVTLRLLHPLPPSADRKGLARHARQVIAAALSSVNEPTGL
ncbi:1-acyl-sn-glycerol-3-phosphate acyltransferase [Sphingomonas sp. G124]|uniref:1-acyl-sn-glycerol-3-phosphate acyltransferase n=1 Tax=Sphingomonas cremea TaxID=2904799 RepID=A0A9X1TX65_9SPHN|nr:lysophospholipid acyltransferase family protein [Sphingomonas cremea]MCF2513532.1 1-acyl-sn-glycerol-3-phosphate acyltransferase [Sphingomonas cremea]